MKNRLLYKTLWVYSIYATLVLIILAPLFYGFTSYWLREEAEEFLLYKLDEFVKHDKNLLHTGDIQLWNTYNAERQLIPEPQHPRPKFVDSFFFNPLENENDPAMVLYAPVVVDGTNYLFTTRVNLMEDDEVLGNILYVFIAMLCLLFVGLISLARWYNAKLWSPYFTTLTYLEKFEVDKPIEPHFENVNIDEFKRLNEIVEKLIRKNLQIYSNQKEFIQNTAHEWHTPLAILQGQIDNMLQDEHLTETQMMQIQKLQNSVSRLTHLNRNLLLLSRLSYDAFNKFEEVSLNKLVLDQMEFYKEQAEGLDIRLKIDLFEEIDLLANIQLLDILVSNLLSNAIKHSPSGSEVSLSLSKIGLKITNAATNGPLDTSNLFQSFGKVAESSKGYGLGLSIIKGICDKSHWQVDYEFENGRHVFNVFFLQNKNRIGF